ncbi:helix-turn-helix transcriptional regulator [Natronorubrum sp. FCH18a]|uniref:helix-turn-helix transcriptional regulator n=1 Tax=Natronorubrum sp. FCH18a TaxID=3447018 RepID=UPI003F511E1D
MVSTSQIEVGPALASIHSSVFSSTVPVPIRRLDVQAFASAVPSDSDQFGGPVSWLSILRGTSFWEVAMITVLFLLISGLVGIRLRELLSNREVELSTHPLISQSAAESDEMNSSPTDDHRPYEQYLSPDTPAELLSDKGEVVRLLVANHGRIRQHQIADETGWSKSKVSRICSQMHTDGTIEKTSVGRENLITLSDREPPTETQCTDTERPLQ